MELRGLVGQELVGYRLTRLLGEGASALVFRGENVLTPRVVRALKVVRPELSSDPEFAARFAREAELLERLVHPNIVRFHGMRQERGLLVMELELLAGESLAERLAGGGVTPRDAVAWIRQAAEGLAAAHAAGVCHRDVKPANLLLTPEGSIKILDFGIARAAADSRERLTRVGHVVGTPRYVAPELLTGAQAEASGESDVFSLGVTLFELLLGYHPLDPPGTPPRSVAQSLITYAAARYPALRALRPELPEALEHVVTRAVARDPRARFPDARAVAAALRLIEAGRGITEAAPAGGETSFALPLPSERGAASPREAQPVTSPRRAPVQVTEPSKRGGSAPPAAPTARERAGPRDEVPPAQAPSPRRPLLFAVGGAVILVVLVLMGWALFAGSPSSAAPRYVRVEPGSYRMGSPAEEPGHQPEEVPREVSVDSAFQMRISEVTQGEWRDLMGTEPAYFANCGAACPVERVSWWDAAAYCNALSRREGLPECYRLDGCVGVPGSGCPGGALQCDGDYRCADGAVALPGCTGYRLPTEAEWEYAARAGTTAATYAGALVPRGANDAPTLDSIAWYGGNSGVDYAGGVGCAEWPERQSVATTCGPQPVATKRPNGWGLHDILGNVWEWCGDDPSRGGAAVGGANRATRGGGWSSQPLLLRAAYRVPAAAVVRSSILGFRPVRSAP